MGGGNDESLSCPECGSRRFEIFGFRNVRYVADGKGAREHGNYSQFASRLSCMGPLLQRA